MLITQKRAQRPSFLSSNCDKHNKVQLFAKFQKIVYRATGTVSNFRKFIIGMSTVILFSVAVFTFAKEYCVEEVLWA